MKQRSLREELEKDPGTGEKRAWDWDCLPVEHAGTGQGVVWGGRGLGQMIFRVPPSLSNIPCMPTTPLSLCPRHLPAAGVNLAHIAARSEWRGDTLKETLPGSGGWGHVGWRSFSLAVGWAIPKHAAYALQKNPTRMVWLSSPQHSGSP